MAQGAKDEVGGKAAGSRVDRHDLHATVLHRLGIGSCLLVAAEWVKRMVGTMTMPTELSTLSGAGGGQCQRLALNEGDTVFHLGVRAVDIEDDGGVGREAFFQG